MGKTPEAKVRDPVVKWAKANGFLHHRMSFRPGVRAGVPDDVFILPGGVHVWIEFKAPDKKPTALQMHRIKQLLAHGVIARWADDPEVAIDFLRNTKAVAESCEGGTLQ